MIKSIKYTALTLILGFMQIGSMQASCSALKQFWKPVTAAGVAGTVVYAKDQIADWAKTVVIEELCEDLVSDEAIKFKSELISNLPDHLKPKVADIRFIVNKPRIVIDPIDQSSWISSVTSSVKAIAKTTIYTRLLLDNAAALEHQKKEYFLLTGPNGLSFLTDFTLLHEFAHHLHKDPTRRENLVGFGLASSTYGSMQYLLSAKSKARFVIAPLCFASALVFFNRVVNNNFGVAAEEAADDFAIKSLEEHKNIAALKAGKVFFEKYKPVIDEDLDIKLRKIGLSTDLVARIGARSRPLGSFLYNLAHDHPTMSSRIEKIKDAISRIEE